MHGEWGKVLGVKSEHLVRGGVLPQTAHTAFKSGAELAQALGIAGLLLPHRVELPEDNSLKGKGSQHSVGVWYSPDLALLIALKLMDPLLNSRETPMFFEPEPRLPAGLVSGPTYFSADETRQRRAAIERALAALPALLKRLLPGVDPATVRIIAIGLSSFIDAVNPQNNQATSVYAFLLGISNLHPAVAQSPLGVVLAGLWNPPTVVSAKKVAGEDTSMTASKRTQGNRAAVDAFSQEAAVARPMRKLLQREPLVMHTRLFPGLWNVPEQYVAFCFYHNKMHADAPVMANLTGKVEQHDFVAGGHGEELSRIPREREDPALGPVFDLPPAYDGDVVAEHFDNVSTRPAHAPEHKSSKIWLSINHFNSVVPPVLLYSWWKSKAQSVSDYFERLAYDTLHCYFIGLLVYFMDIVVIIINNSNATMERGNLAAGQFDERIGALPAHDEGFRKYRQYAEGYTKRPLNSGNDNFYIICTFVWAIGLDDQLIPDPSLRAVVLASCEAATVLAHLLHAEALTREARTATYKATRRFLKKLLLPAFVDRQRSRWAILKFRMLLWIVNGLGGGSPTSTNSSKFEAALRIYVSRILKRASGNQDCLRDVVKHYLLRATMDRLRGAGGPVAEALAQAAIVPARRKLLGRIGELNGTAALSMPMAEPPGGSDGAFLKAIRADWAAFPHHPGVGQADGGVDFGRAKFFNRAWLPREEERFAAYLYLRRIVELNPLSLRFAAAAAAAAPEDIRDDPALAKLARVLAIFYLPPAPDAAGGGDSFSSGSGKPDPNRMFVLLHPFAEQGAGDRDRLSRLGLQFHAVRVPAAAQPQPGAAAGAQRPMPWHVFPLRDVLRVVRAGPERWPAFNPDADGRFTTAREMRAEAAECRTGAVLVFWPPTRGTYWPTGASVAALRAAEEEEEEEEGA